MTGISDKEVEGIGDRITYIADYRGIRLPDITKAIGANRGYMHKLLHNEVKNPHKYIDKIAALLEVSK